MVSSPDDDSTVSAPAPPTKLLSPPVNRMLLSESLPASTVRFEPVTEASFRNDFEPIVID